MQQQPVLRARVPGPPPPPRLLPHPREHEPPARRDRERVHEPARGQAPQRHELAPRIVADAPQTNRAVSRAARADVRALSHGDGVHPPSRVAHAARRVRGERRDAAQGLRVRARLGGGGGFLLREKFRTLDAVLALSVDAAAEPVHAPPAHHRALLRRAPQRHRAVVRPGDPRVRGRERARLQVPVPGGRAEDELRILRDFPKPTRPVPPHGDDAFASLRVHGHDVGLMPEQR
eukprot:30308-Pelagococcus_subviridis.AAC.22